VFHQLALNIPLYRRQHVRNVLRRIHALKPKVAKLSDQQLKKQSLELQFRARSGEAADKLVAQAFSLAQETSHRVLGMRHYDVQLISGINLTSECVVEMATGEGKTLTAILPLYLRGLYGKGAHLATANDYLARRDADETRPVFEHLGLTVGTVQHESDDQQRTEAYACDVTYGTMSEFGFDFLRDRMKMRMIRSSSGPTSPDDAPKTVHRKLHYILVDEADSIMVDDASTPLIIGAMPTPESEEKVRLYRWAAQYADQATEGQDFRHLEHKKKIELTESGRNWVRKMAHETNVAGLAVVDQYEFMERAIKVERDYFRDKNYVLADSGEVTIVDENTGRLAVGRFWQDGMHQAIQAREHVDVTAPLSSAARVSVQSLVCSYPNRSGMTGTGISAKREF
jgi:preprotein translocase subunit SecA